MSHVLKRVLFCAVVLSLSACKLTVTNDGGGLVTSKSGKIECGNSCKVDYSQYSSSGSYTEVLTAHPDEGYQFTGWSGDCSGASTCSVTLSGSSSDKQVTAHFAEIEYPVDAKDILSFRFLSALNTDLVRDVYASIDNTSQTITAKLPYSADLSTLVSTFFSSGEVVTVEDVVQVSSETVNDFTDPVAYRVTAQDSSTQHYTVSLSREACPEKVWEGDYQANNNDALAQLKGYTTLDGSLTVATGNIAASLAPLNCLSSITGDLTLSTNTALKSLNGLNDLQSVGGSVQIEQNNELTDLKGLNALTGIGGSLTIDRNGKLLNLDALSNL